MADFVSTFALLICLTALFSVVGFGFVCILLISNGRLSLKTGWLLSPLVGYVLISATGIAKLMSFVQLGPALNVFGLISTSLLLCWLRRNDIRKSIRDCSKADFARLVLPALIGMVCFSLTFSNGGLQLLSGSEDELQYCSNAAHMLLDQNTGLSSDTPLPRMDHWLYDWQSRFQCRQWTYRKGAEVLLATVIGITGLAPPLAFPVLCG